MSYNVDWKRDQDEHLSAKFSGLTILSFGAGQDSTAILLEELETRRLGIDAVVFADTGNEEDHTYETVERAQRLCISAGIHFEWIRPGSQYHTPAWQSLLEYWDSNDTVNIARAKACTEKLKIIPIYKWLNALCAVLLDEPVEDTGKKNLVRFANEYGKVRMLIGISKGEEKRLGKEFPRIWQRESVVREYPLTAWGWDREACQAFLEARFDIIGKVWPSTCKYCHFQSMPELLWRARNDPEGFAEWTQFEARKIARFADRPKNHGVYGVKLLPVKLIEAEEKFGHLTDAELDEYKYSHGHQVTNSY